MRKGSKVNAKLKITQSETTNQEEVVVRRREVDEAGKFLCIYVTMKGTWKQEVAEWMGKSRQFSGKVRRANFNRTCGIRLFSFLWVPKFRYSAGVVGYSKRQCEKIEKPVVSACLSASGSTKSFHEV